MLLIPFISTSILSLPSCLYSYLLSLTTKTGDGSIVTWRRTAPCYVFIVLFPRCFVKVHCDNRVVLFSQNLWRKKSTLGRALFMVYGELNFLFLGGEDQDHDDQGNGTNDYDPPGEGLGHKRTVPCAPQDWGFLILLSFVSSTVFWIPFTQPNTKTGDTIKRYSKTFELRNCWSSLAS